MYRGAGGGVVNRRGPDSQNPVCYLSVFVVQAKMNMSNALFLLSLPCARVYTYEPCAPFSWNPKQHKIDVVIRSFVAFVVSEACFILTFVFSRICVPRA